VYSQFYVIRSLKFVQVIAYTYV